MSSLFHSVDGVASAPKHVASRTLSPEDLTSSNSTLITGDPVDYVRTLKEGTGADIAVQGSLSIVSQLLEAGLIDALTLAIHSVVAGAGRGIFDGDAPKRLSLTDVQNTSKGNLLVTNGPRQD
ncbi:dihydrofolate reductase family protein [Brevibacterium sp. 239c]|uniref:dihydrofolate reductase family protein n=1 Tax=Brevibacterium sp. 239c TaxID=1965356 RepID=UPI002152D3B1|nr:dihydrofolate reductase family protein [Brevibacterium sp. 239c]